MTREGAREGGTPADVARPAAIVFDMDGLLLDTERVVLDGFLHACRAHAVPPDPGAYYRCIGTTMERTRELLIEGYGPDFPYDAIVATWNDYCDEHLVRRAPPVKPGALEMLQRVRRHAIPCALATATWDPEASERLAMVGLDEFFSVRVTGDQVTRGKPDPEPYLSATARLGVEPAHAWALEDSAHGVRSAFTAGLEVFQIPDLVPPDPSLLTLGHTVFDSLFDADDLLRRILDGDEAAAA